MAKLLTITDCDQCLYVDQNWYNSCEHPAVIKGRPTPAGTIPSWCPLPDAPEHENSTEQEK